MLLNDYRGPAIYRLTPYTTTDSYGDTIETWETPKKTRLLGASAQPVTEVEADGVTKHILKDVKDLFYRSNYKVSASDRILIGTEQWRVEGNPEVRQPLSTGGYGVARLVRVTGKDGA